MSHSSHGLQDYLRLIKDETAQVQGLIKELSKVTEGVDPDAGYTRTLLDISNRSLNCNKVLLAEVASSTKEAPLQQSVFSLREFMMIFPPPKSRRFEGFL